MNAQAELDADITAFDAAFETWKETHPGKKFSDFSLQRMIHHLDIGKSHASLGENLNSGKDWREDGQKPFDYLVKFLTSSTDLDALPKDFVVCDYGCGTLRLGWHLMTHLEAGNYCGMDLSDELIDFGRRGCTDLIAQKNPLIGAFADTLPQATALQPDLVFTFNVGGHVHPEEVEEYYANIRALCSKPGSIAIIHVLAHTAPHDEVVRFQRSGWAWPLEHAKAALAPMRVLNEIHFQDVRKGPHDLSSYYLVVQRDG